MQKSKDFLGGSRQFLTTFKGDWSHKSAINLVCLCSKPGLRVSGQVSIGRRTAASHYVKTKWWYERGDREASEASWLMNADNRNSPKILLMDNFIPKHGST